MADSTKSRRINWLHLLTVGSAAILIGAEVFGAAFAGAWAIATLFSLEAFGAHVLEVIFFACGLAIMVSFVRGANRVEPLISSD
ncbi:MAG TPA: hypothetical protein VFB45_03175 [Pseudolabrys sp.]|nr:hypothetical protein [Pseudolabrys sp.]